MKTMLPEQMAFEDTTGADSLENGLKAYKKSDYIQALELLCPIAEKGNILAQGILGRMYLRGEGVIQNYQEAAKWYRLAAKSCDDKSSQYHLSLLYSTDRHISRKNATSY
jgi:TPR repeat protein